MHVVLDSTGLKVYGAGEWQTEKHGERGRRTWRKLHLAVNPDNVPGSMASILADAAYDAEPVYRAVAERQLQPPPAVIIPPCATAVLSPRTDSAPSLRDQHIQLIQEQGRRGWEKAVGYGKRALVETAMFRYKVLIGPQLHARTLASQKTEARIGCSVINRMTQLGMPLSQRVR